MQDPLISKFLWAADQRLAAAEKLLPYEVHGLESIYLAGYSVEMLLKALILAESNPSRRHQILETEFKGNKGHDFGYLRQKLSKNVRFPPPVLQCFLRVSDWSTVLRYEVGFRRYKNAAEFISAVKVIRECIRKLL